MPARPPTKPKQTHVDLTAVRTSALSKLEEAGSQKAVLRLLPALASAAKHPTRDRARRRDDAAKELERLLDEGLELHAELHAAEWLNEPDMDESCEDPTKCEGIPVLAAHGAFLAELKSLDLAHRVANVVPYRDPLPSRAEAIAELQTRHHLSFREIVALGNPKLKKVPVQLVAAREAALREAKSSVEREIEKKRVRTRTGRRTRS